MFQYKAILQKENKIIAQGHKIDDIYKQIVHFKRQQKYHKHTSMNNKIKIYHIYRNQLQGKQIEKLVKIV